MFAALGWQPESQGLLSIRSTPSVCGTAKRSHITLRTSKPLSRLVKASFNPLLADEILSNTIPIKAWCASEIATRSRRPVSVSGCVPDNPGLFLLLSLGVEYSGLRAAEALTSGLSGSGEILHDNTSGSSAP